MTTIIRPTRLLAAVAASLSGLCFIAAIPGCSTGPKETSAQVVAGQKADAAKMVDFGSEKMEHFMSFGQTEALKNMLGGERGIFIAPYVKGEAALLGMENGTGYLLRRHGKVSSVM